MRTSTQQRGAVLIVGLIILTILTILGMTSIQTTTLEERMAGNTLSSNSALQATEAALRQGEATVIGPLFNTKPIATTDGSTGVWVLESPDPDVDGDPWWTEADWAWWTANAVTFATPGTVDLEFAAGAAPNALPHQLIEEHQFVKDTLNLGQVKDLTGRQFYQITGRGTDVSGNATAILRSTYARRF